jgi:hypothetical protein
VLDARSPPPPTGVRAERGRSGLRLTAFGVSPAVQGSGGATGTLGFSF